MANAKPDRFPQAGSLLSWAARPHHDSPPALRLLHGLVRLFLITTREFSKNDLPLRSAALTYTILLSLVPMLAMSTAVIKGLGGGNQLREVAYGYIDTLEGPRPPVTPMTGQPGETTILPVPPATPPDTLTTHLRDAVDRLFAYVEKTNFATLGSFGVAGILVSVILVFGNIELALNAIWHVHQSRSILRKIADYLTLLVLMPLSINLAFAAGALLTSPTLSARFQLFIPFTWLQTLILKLVPVFFIALTFYVIYIFFPNTKVRNRPAMAGAAFAAILWFMVQNAYISLQIGVSNYNAIYGSFATLPLFLVWMYLGWLFVLSGAQVAYACQHLHSYRLLPESALPARRLSAAFDIIAAVQNAFRDSRPLAKEDLDQVLPEYSADLIDDIVQQLKAAELLYVVGSEERLLPAGPAETLGRQPIITAIFGSETGPTEGGHAADRILRSAAQAGSDLQRQEGESST